VYGPILPNWPRQAVQSSRDLRSHQPPTPPTAFSHSLGQLPSSRTLSRTSAIGSGNSNRDITAKHRLRPLRRHVSVRRAEINVSEIRKLISRWHLDEVGAERNAARRKKSVSTDSRHYPQEVDLKYKIREFPRANRLVGLPLASNSVSISGAPQRPPRTVDHNVSVILNDQVRSRMPLGICGPDRSRRPVKYKVPIGLHDRLRDCAADGACRPPGG
jgi:hypothetical protein